MDAQDLSSSQGRTRQLLQARQLFNNSAILQRLNTTKQAQLNMAPDPTAYHGSSTTLAMDCKHVIHYSVPSALSIQLSRPADTYGTASDWEDGYEPTEFVCLSANTLLCNDCEEIMRTELRDAAEAYSLIWADRVGSSSPPNEASKAASDRYVQAAIEVANFEGRMADRENTISQADAKKAKEQKWEAGKKVRFNIEEGEGAGEKPKKEKEKMPAIALGWVEVDRPESPPTTPQTDDTTEYVFAYRPKQL